MPTTTVLRELERVQWALVLSIEDLPYAWTTHRDLEGTGFFDDEREVLPGLIPPTYEMELDPNSDFQFKRTVTEITVEDFDGRLAELLAGFDGNEAELFPSVETGDDLALRTELHGQQVGNEAIGPGGERNIYPALPGFSRPRLHIGLDYELDEVAAAPVSERPVILEGRRVVLFRVYRDHVTYPDTSEGFASWRPVAEAETIWWGTLRKAGHDIDGREWALQCDGPESWIYKRLAMLSQERPVRVWAPMLLDDTPGADETRIGVYFSGREGGGASPEVYGESDLVAQVTADDTIGVRSEVGALVGSVATTVAGPDMIFVDSYGQTIVVNVADGSISIRIAGDLVATRFAQLSLVLHEKVWKRWGFDPQVQTALAGDDEFFVLFSPIDVGGPGPGYWEARLTTKPNPNVSDAAAADNDGLPRIWKPLYPGGAMVLEPGAGQVLNLGDGIVHHAGQIDRPPLGDPDDASQPYPLGTGVNRQGLWLVTGPRRFAGQDDDFPEAQVCQASWREPAQDLAQVGGDPPQIVVQRWLNPRRYGVPRPRMQSPWVAVQNDAELTVYARPLLRLGYMPHDGDEDQAHLVIQRMLYTTGQTAGWAGYEGGGATLGATANEPAAVPLGLRLDAEHEDLGCMVPRDRIRPPLYWTPFAQRLSDALRRVSLAITPGMETESLFRGLMTPRGWGWSLAGGQYGLLDITATLTPAGGVLLDYSRKATGATSLRDHKRAKQQVRAFTPKDRYVRKYDWNPIDGSFRVEDSMRSPDKGSRYRPYPGDRVTGGRTQTASEHVVEDHGARTGGGWRSRASEVARWYDRGQFWIHDYPVMRRPGQDLWLGTKVVLTEPRAASPDGTYGVVGAVGIVTSVKGEKGGERYLCDILVDLASITRLRFNAPVARGRGYNPATRQLLVDDDHLEVGGGHNDAEHFVEPAWSQLGGNAQVQVRQWNGAVWTLTATGTVSGVSTTPGSSRITIAAPGLTGTYRRDDDALITLDPEQTAPWVLAFFSPICDEAGEWNAPAEEGYPWG